MTAPNLSLYKIETELLDLMRFREDVAQDTDLTPQEQTASLEAIDKQITEYVHREVAKVDGIAAYLRECETRAAVLKTEAMRIKAQADAWTARHDRLEAVTLRVMQQTGATLLEGATSTFKVKKNPPSVDVAQPELVPAAYQRIRVTMSKHVWHRMIQALSRLADTTVYADALTVAVSDSEPMKDAIKAELKAGVGVPGCTLIDDKERLEIK